MLLSSLDNTESISHHFLPQDATSSIPFLAIPDDESQDCDAALSTNPDHSRPAFTAASKPSPWRTATYAGDLRMSSTGDKVLKPLPAPPPQIGHEAQHDSVSGENKPVNHVTDTLSLYNIPTISSVTPVDGRNGDKSRKVTPSAQTLTLPVSNNISTLNRSANSSSSNSLFTAHGPMMITGGNFTQISQIKSGSVSWGLKILKDGVAPNALYNSGTKLDQPKCHPNTRVAVLQRIVDWVYLNQRLETEIKMSHSFIMWLNGPAGAGKTAIAHSIIDILSEKNLFLAGFFFWRTDPTRKHAGSFIATLAYQLYFSLPATQGHILAAIENDPLILTRTVTHQFTTLIINPLIYLTKSPEFTAPFRRYAIVIDGLDECEDRSAQCRILEMISNAIHQHTLPVIFLIASRPELEIRTTFNSASISRIMDRLTLDNRYKPDKDIELFLRDNFSKIKKEHPFRYLLPPSWPSDDAIQTLVRKSSGQFVYVFTVVKYVQFLRRRPDHSLDIVLNLCPPNKDLPFRELDSLYRNIISSVQDVEKVLEVLSYVMSVSAKCSVYLYDIEVGLFLEKGGAEILLCDLHSIISINHDKRIKLLHASLQDYLSDPIRSGNFYIDIDVYRTKHIMNYFRSFSRPGGVYSRNTYYFFLDNLAQCISSPEVVDQIPQHKAANTIFTSLFSSFIPSFFKLLYKLTSEGHRNIKIDNYLKDLDLILLSKIPFYFNKRLEFLRLIWYCLRGTHHYYPDSLVGLYNYPWNSMEADPLNLGAPVADSHISSFVNGVSFQQYLRDFLWDSKRSKGYALGPSVVFELAAYHCLSVLVVYNLPERWGSFRWKETTLPSVNNSSEEYIEDMSDGSDDDDELPFPLIREHDGVPIGVRFQMTYFYVLGFLLYHLPHAQRYEPLVELCQNPGPCFYHGKYRTRSLEVLFPKRFALALREMNKYLERIGVKGGVWKPESYLGQRITNPLSVCPGCLESTVNQD